MSCATTACTHITRGRRLVAHRVRGTASLVGCARAQVTNTPWGERVRFVFRPAGEVVQKALHVSPFMDMRNTWCVRAPP